MDNIVDIVYGAINRLGLVQIEISARHVHLCSADVETLFGKGYTLTPKRKLSQPGQFLCEERVEVVGAKGSMKSVAILGPARENTQVELSLSDCMALGVSAPIRESGDVRDTGSLTLQTPNGKVEIATGAIVAKAHIHMPPSIAQELGLRDKQSVMVEAMTDRPVIYKDVMIRVSDKFSYRMHIDFDEANCAHAGKFTLGRIIPKSEERDRYYGTHQSERVYGEGRAVRTGNLSS